MGGSSQENIIGETVKKTVFEKTMKDTEKNNEKQPKTNIFIIFCIFYFLESFSTIF